MRKTYLIKTLIWTGLSFLLCACGASKPQAAGESMHVDDLWAITEYIERTAQDAQVPEKCIRFLDSKPFVAYVDGSLFGKKTDGTLQLDEDFVIKSVQLYSAELAYEEALQQFTAWYGEPVAKGEDPNVEIDGGIVTWHKFNTGKYIVTLSKASGYDYIEKRIEQV